MVGVAVNVTLVPAQIVLSASLETILTLGTKTRLTVVVIPELVPVNGEAHTAFDVKIQVTISPFTKPVVVYVVPPVPTGEPFKYHWYTGPAPPLVGVAVNVTLVPAQIVLSASLDPIFTLGTKTGFTVIVPLALTVPHPPVNGIE